jgi:hypothetical protein
MKLKNIALVICIQISFFSTYAQLKIKDGGRVGIGTNDVSWFKMNINAPYTIMALNLRNSTPDWGYISRAQVTSSFTKSWVVSWNGSDRFFVLGNGAYFYKSGWQWSDATLKRNVQTIDSALNKINRLRGVYFQYKPEVPKDSAISGTVVVSDNKRYIGLIAQEVKIVIPEAVNEDNNQIQAVAYENLVGLLIEGMKAQQAQITTLQQSITSLQQSVSSCCGLNLSSGTTGEDSLNQEQSFVGTNQAERTEISNKLYQNHPNPFTENTTIEYEIVKPFKNAVLYVYNFQGEQLKSFIINSTGKGSLNIRGNDLKPGIYLYDLIIDNKPVGTKKMILTQ